MNQSRPTVLIIAVLLCCLGTLAIAVIAGGFLLVSRSTGGLLSVTPTWIPTETILISPTSTLEPPPLTLEASNFYMATDEDGTNKTNIFSPDQDFFVFFDVAGIEAGTAFQSRWYGLDIEDVDPNVPFQTIDYPYEEGITTIYFQLTSDVPWPAGSYKVEVYMNGAKVGEQGFAVQE